MAAVFATCFLLASLSMAASQSTCNSRSYSIDLEGQTLFAVNPNRTCSCDTFVAQSFVGSDFLVNNASLVQRIGRLEALVASQGTIIEQQQLVITDLWQRLEGISPAAPASSGISTASSPVATTPGFTTSPRTTASMTTGSRVLATNNYNVQSGGFDIPSGAFPAAGRTVRFQVSGSWTSCSFCAATDGFGESNLCTEASCPVVGGRRAALVARWGSSAWFTVGLDYTGVIPASPSLRMMANDHDTSDNNGALNVQITVWS